MYIYFTYMGPLLKPRAKSGDKETRVESKYFEFTSLQFDPSNEKHKQM
jgi:hypothetical protein